MVARGKKRHWVTLSEPGEPVPDGEGGFTETPVALSPPGMYAEIKPATARDLERVTAGAVQATATHLVTMDYHPEVTTETIVTFGTRTFSVTGIQNPDERDRELVLVCTESVA